MSDPTSALLSMFPDTQRKATDAEPGYLSSLKNESSSGAEAVSGLESGFSKRAANFFHAAQDQGYTPVITSGKSTGGHNPGSAHYQGQAVDFYLKDAKGHVVEPGAVKGFNDQMSQLGDTHGVSFHNEWTRPAGQAVWGGPHFHIGPGAATQQQAPSPPPTDPTTSLLSMFPSAAQPAPSLQGGGAAPPPGGDTAFGFGSGGSVAPPGAPPPLLPAPNDVPPQAIVPQAPPSAGPPVTQEHLNDLTNTFARVEGADAGGFSQWLQQRGANPMSVHSAGPDGRLGYAQLTPDEIQQAGGGHVTTQDYLNNSSLQLSLAAKLYRNQVPGGAVTPQAPEMAPQISTFSELQKNLVSLTPWAYPSSVTQSMFSSPQEMQQYQSTSQNLTMDYLKRTVGAATAGFSNYLPMMQQSGALAQLEQSIPWSFSHYGLNTNNVERFGLGMLPDIIGTAAFMAMTRGMGSIANMAGKAGPSLPGTITQIGMGMEMPEAMSGLFQKAGIASAALAGESGSFVTELKAWAGLSGLAGFNGVMGQGLNEGKSPGELMPQALAAMVFDSASAMALMYTAKAGVGLTQVTGMGLKNAFPKAFGDTPVGFRTGFFLDMAKKMPALASVMENTVGKLFPEQIGDHLHDAIKTVGEFQKQAQLSQVTDYQAISKDVLIQGHLQTADAVERALDKQMAAHKMNELRAQRAQTGLADWENPVPQGPVDPMYDRKMAVQTQLQKAAAVQSKLEDLQSHLSILQENGQQQVRYGPHTVDEKWLTTALKDNQKYLDKVLSGTDIKNPDLGNDMLNYAKAKVEVQKANGALSQSSQWDAVRQEPQYREAIDILRSPANVLRDAAATSKGNPFTAHTLPAAPYVADQQNISGPIELAKAAFQDTLGRIHVNPQPSQELAGLSGEAAIRKGFQMQQEQQVVQNALAAKQFTNHVPLGEDLSPQAILRNNSEFMANTKQAAKYLDYHNKIADARDALTQATGSESEQAASWLRDRELLNEGKQSLDPVFEAGKKISAEPSLQDQRVARITAPHLDIANEKLMNELMPVVNLRCLTEAEAVPSLKGMALLQRILPDLRVTPPQMQAIKSMEKSLDIYSEFAARAKEIAMRHMAVLSDSTNRTYSYDAIQGVVRRLVDQSPAHYGVMQAYDGFARAFGNEMPTMVKEMVDAGLAAMPEGMRDVRASQIMEQQMRARITHAIEEPAILRAKDPTVDMTDPAVYKNLDMYKMAQASPSAARAMHLVMMGNVINERMGLAAPELSSWFLNDYMMHKFTGFSQYAASGGDMADIGHFFTSVASDKQRSIPSLAEAKNIHEDTLASLADKKVTPEKFLAATNIERARMLGYDVTADVRDVGNFTTAKENAPIMNDVYKHLVGLLMKDPIEDPMALFGIHLQSSLKANGVRSFLRLGTSLIDPDSGRPLIELVDESGSKLAKTPGGALANTGGTYAQRTGFLGRGIEEVNDYTKLATVPGMRGASLDGVPTDRILVHPTWAKALNQVLGAGDGKMNWLQTLNQASRPAIIFGGSPIMHAWNTWMGLLNDFGGNLRAVTQAYTGGAKLIAEHPERYQEIIQAVPQLARMQLQLNRLHMSNWNTNYDPTGQLTQFLTDAPHSSFEKSLTSVANWAQEASKKPGLPGKAAGAAGDFLDQFLANSANTNKGWLTPLWHFHDMMLYRPAEYAMVAATEMHTGRILQTPEFQQMLTEGVSPAAVKQLATEAAGKRVLSAAGLMSATFWDDSMRKACDTAFFAPGLMMNRAEKFLSVFYGVTKQLGMQSKFDALAPGTREEILNGYRKMFVITTVGAAVYTETLNHLLNGTSTFRNPPGAMGKVHIGNDGTKDVYLPPPDLGFTRAWVRGILGAAGENSLNPLIRSVEDEVNPVARGIVGLFSGKDPNGEEVMPPHGVPEQLWAGAKYMVGHSTSLGQIWPQLSFDAQGTDGRHAHALSDDPVGWMLDRAGWGTGIYPTYRNVSQSFKSELMMERTNLFKPIFEQAHEMLYEAAVARTNGNMDKSTQLLQQVRQLKPPDVPRSAVEVYDAMSKRPGWDGTLPFPPGKLQKMIQMSMNPKMQAYVGVPAQFKQYMMEHVAGND